MELRQLEYFTAVARHRHFGRAADEVYVTQSALSQQIGKLEAELGVTLLSRSAKGVELTPAGAELDEHAKAILLRVAEARKAIDEHLGATRGIARIAATAYDSAKLPPAIVAFHRAHPHIQLSLRHGPPAQLIELLVAGAVDAALLGFDEQESLLPQGVLVTSISQEPLRLLCAAGDPLADAKGTTIEALRGVPVILPERGTALRALILRSCQTAGFSPLPLFETSDPHTIQALVAEGLGRSAVPVSWLHDEDPAISAASFADPALLYRVALLHREQLSPVGALVVNGLLAFFAAQ